VPDVLVTGFGPFPGVDRNPSGEVLASVAGPDVETILLPVDFRRAIATLTEAIPRLRPRITVLFGVAAAERSVRVERVARNHGSSTAPDVSGWIQGRRPLVAGAPATYLATLPTSPILEALTGAGWPAESSDDAGGYVCNAAFFAALHVIAARKLRTHCGFVHIPGATGWSASQYQALTQTAINAASGKQLGTSR
jgi:pyroglutamyl-peptidase